MNIVMNRMFYVAICVILHSISAYAQEAGDTVLQPVVYSLAQCVNEALANNLRLRNADKQIMMSDEQQKEAFTKYFPTLSAMGGGFISDEGLAQIDMGGQRLSMLKNGMVAGVTAMQPIFAGGQIVNGNRLAKVGKEVSQLQRGLTENEVRLSTESYFWQAMMLKEKLKTLDYVERQLAEVKKDAQAAVDAGIKNRNDLLQVNLRYNETRTGKINVKNKLRTVCDMLAQVMGHAGENIDVCGNDSLPADPMQLYVAPETALLQTREYRLLEKQVEANQLEYKLSVGKNLPSVAVGGGYAYNNLMDRSQNNFVGMLTVKIPISDWWGGSHDMKRRKLQVASAVDDRTSQSEMLIIRINSVWNDLNDAFKQVGIAQESIEQSEENLRLNTDYYNAGTSTISDVLDAQTLYQQSRDQYVESLAKYEIKRREYLQATGR